jgi:catalase (peroxidase I)
MNEQCTVWLDADQTTLLIAYMKSIKTSFQASLAAAFYDMSETLQNPFFSPHCSMR